MERISSIIKMRMSTQDAHYGGNLVDGAKIIQLFGDAGTECLIKLDGDEGLLKKYEDIEMKCPIYVGDFVEVYAEIIKIGNTSRTIYFEARKTAIPRPDISDSACDYLTEPIVICQATCIAVVKKEKQRK